MRVASPGLVGGIALSCIIAADACAGVSAFCDKAEWLKAVGVVETIDFTGFDVDTIVTDHFIRSHGVVFTDGLDFIWDSCAAFPNDCYGIRGHTTTTLAFASPRHWIGVDYPGALAIELYADGELIACAEFCGCCNLVAFGGLISSKPFDEAVLIDWVDNSLHVDDIHLGPVFCPEDTDDDVDVDVDDLVAVILHWGCMETRAGPCAADVDRDGDVDIDDLTAVILAWGQCPG